MLDRELNAPARTLYLVQIVGKFGTKETGRYRLQRREHLAVRQERLAEIVYGSAGIGKFGDHLPLVALEYPLLYFFKFFSERVTFVGECVVQTARHRGEEVSAVGYGDSPLLCPNHQT